MPVYKITYFFNLAEQGWTENYFKEAHDPQAATDVGFRENEIIRWRAAGCQLFAIRASDVDLPRSSFTRFIGISVAPDLTGGGAVRNLPDVTTTCVLWRVTNVVTSQRRFVWLRGVQDRDVNRRVDGTKDPSAALNAALIQYASFLRDQSYLIRYLQPAQAPYQWYPVTALRPNNVNPNWTEFDVPTAIAGQNPGDRVYFRQADRRVLPYLKGAYPAYQSNVTPTTYVIHFKLIQSGPVAPANLQVRRQSFLTSLMTNFQIEDFREHLTGRPTERYRGRRSASRVAH